MGSEWDSGGEGFYVEKFVRMVAMILTVLAGGGGLPGGERGECGGTESGGG